MNNDKAIFIHDVCTALFLIPYSTLCVAEVFFNYTVYPLFLTHALFVHMFYDTVWLCVQPNAVSSFRKYILFHHVMCMSLLLHPMMVPYDSDLTALSGLVEIDTSVATLRRLFRRTEFFNKLYIATNVLLRFVHETYMLFFIWFYFKDDSTLVRLHIMSGQYFLTFFSYGICVLSMYRGTRFLKDE
jgi:hypothetical protein